MQVKRLSQCLAHQCSGTGHCFSPWPPTPSFLQKGPPWNQQGCGTHGTRRPGYSLGVTSDWSCFNHTPQSGLRQRGRTSFGLPASCSGSLPSLLTPRYTRVHTLKSQDFVSSPCGKAENLDNCQEVWRAGCCKAVFAIKICLCSPLTKLIARILASNFMS